MLSHISIYLLVNPKQSTHTVREHADTHITKNVCDSPLVPYSLCDVTTQNRSQPMFIGANLVTRFLRLSVFPPFAVFRPDCTAV
ncbi:hypothetical protein FGIG_06132 [Fasciola gigantica]|uniref:Uncharacterized protein n=1 Tax=Fasciola gigantica TaxID=46835 RepID=A0A504YVA8_FASGI|nr:hypothetical protein FGIG_06132 [Fasciola gigantica]